MGKTWKGPTASKGNLEQQKEGKVPGLEKRFSSPLSTPRQTLKKRTRRRGKRNLGHPLLKKEGRSRETRTNKCRADCDKLNPTGKGGGGTTEKRKPPLRGSSQQQKGRDHLVEGGAVDRCLSRGGKKSWEGKREKVCLLWKGGLRPPGKDLRGCRVRRMGVERKKGGGRPAQRKRNLLGGKLV